MLDEKNSSEQEIHKFSLLSSQWWDPHGPFKTLHHLNPTRIAFIKQKTEIKEKLILDIGCGGGLLSEPLAAEGAFVTAIDMDENALAVANRHMSMNDLSINYINTTAEDLAKSHAQKFDIITCLEMLEHVPNPASVIAAISQLIKPQGHIFLSTINRTPKSFGLAILGAEYILKLLPRGTHNYEQFIRPSELADWLRQYDLSLHDLKGVAYNPFNKKSKLVSDISVNYLAYCTAN